MRKIRFISSITACILCISSAAIAADGDSSSPLGSPSQPTGGGSELTYLQQIANNTYHTLAAINNVPNYLDTITQMALSWLALEDGANNSFIVKTQGDFAGLGDSFVQATNRQNAIQTQIAATYLGFDINDFSKPENSPKILKTIPYVNELTYSSLVGRRPVQAGTFSATNYLRNSLGSNIPHIPGNTKWKGNKNNKALYDGYYKTIMSANSFGAYVLSNLVAQNQLNSQLSTQQQKLITQASQSSWLAQIATEELGKVLRDILLFESQNYVLTTKLVQLQQQQLVAQVMTNSLIVATNQGDEPIMLRKALGLMN